jgi:hypothetical protein
MHRLSKAAVIIILLATCGLGEQAYMDPGLEHGFKNPPDSAKPRVWWHWMNGNITKEGIKLDLEWMKRIGLGGFQNFDAALATPQIVEKRLVYMTPEWKDAFLYATTLADQLGLEMAIAGSPGWSETGGPWVPPAQAMKKLVWSTTMVQGGKPFSGVLPKPPSATGPFQNIPRPGDNSPLAKTEFYADSAVIAYRPPDGDTPFSELNPKVTSSGGQFELTDLTDGDFAKANPLPGAPAGEKAWIRFEFAQPQTVRAITLASGKAAGLFERAMPGMEIQRELEAGDDGNEFRTITIIPGGGIGVRTIGFAPVTARFFRVSFTTPKSARPGANMISELILHTGARVNRFEDKAAFVAPVPDLYALATPEVAADANVNKSSVVDLTSQMSGDGTLNWSPPAGRWVVLRMGYSLTGAHNSPASPEATGWEVDKLNRTYVKTYIDNYLGPYKSTLGGLMGKRGLRYLITDSVETGVQNWTDDMIREFARRRGYDPRPWLPVLTGCIVESSEESDRFLWDFRKTIADMIAENHYDQITASLRELGMGRYSESHEGMRVFIADGMEVKRNADIPMSAYWTPRSAEGVEQKGYNADVRESASVAHIYGQNLVAAESFTAAGSAWGWSPETLKPTADIEMAMGLNRFIIHTSVHQPVSDKIPGLGLGPYGQWFTRHETWAEQAKPWISYLARSSYMLQQGRFAADILYFYGEDSNITALFGNKAPDLPTGYNFDYINAGALINQTAVSNGLITAKSGMEYRVLALDPNSSRMSLPVLRKIRDLVREGAVVIGQKPVNSPSLSDSQAEFQKIADDVWGSGLMEHAYGKGKVYGDATVADVLRSRLPVLPDFEYTKPLPDTRLLFVHRKLPHQGEVYWVNNRNNRAEAVEVTFRVYGFHPEIWHPDTGEIDPIEDTPFKMAEGRTTVSLRLDPNDAVFIVFRRRAERPGTVVRTIESSPGRPLTEKTLATLEGSWDVSFQLDRGAPSQITLERLSSWADSSDTGVKYFSGKATYSKTFQASPEWLAKAVGLKVWLDLGSVKNLADVTVNGKSFGIVWKTPFRVDIKDALKPGANTIEVKVTNLWVNRLIGDAQPNVAKKYTYTTQPFYRAESPLQPSGLLGPVRIVRSSVAIIEESAGK